MLNKLDIAIKTIKCKICLNKKSTSKMKRIFKHNDMKHYLLTTIFLVTSLLESV